MPIHKLWVSRSFIEKYFAQLRECVGEAIRISPNFNLTDVKLAQLYVNTTACVLAKTRCSQMNPITGEFQEDDLANKLNIPTVNAVLVNTNYDINIVQLPFHSSSIDVCAKYRNYEQASWPTVMCWLKFSRLTRPRNGDQPWSIYNYTYGLFIISYCSRDRSLDRNLETLRNFLLFLYYSPKL